MTVRRTLPRRDRSLIGAWCFVDHYGPDDVASTGGMDVAPHPHTGLQTVSWLFTGEIEHRDSLGTHALVRPGEVNLMTAGRGIAHSEVSTAGTAVLHGVQLWVALPDAERAGAPAFAHHAAAAVAVGPGATLRVFLGSLAGVHSPLATATPLLGAELVLGPGAQVALGAQVEFEHGVLLDAGSVTVAGQPLAAGELGYLAPGSDVLVLANAGPQPARMLLLGGPPFTEELVMWWNFVGRSHEEIASFRAQWQARSERFGEVPGYAGAVPWLPAPALPNARIMPRRRG
jgi:redox-sensitive bicupin YhaK (pirin superfamily)